MATKRPCSVCGGPCPPSLSQTRPTLSAELLALVDESDYRPLLPVETERLRAAIYDDLCVQIRGQRPPDAGNTNRGRRPIPPEKQARVLAMLARGAAIHAISRQLSLDRRTIRRLRRDHPTSFPKSPSVA